MASASGSVDFGQIYVVNPTGVHVTTIVWLHDIGQTGHDSEQAVKSLSRSNIKWICPTAPIRPVTSLGGRRTTAWFDVYSPIFEGMRDDLGSLNYVTTYVALLLSYEPSHVVKGVGGFGIGASQALFYASSYVIGRVPIHTKIVIGVNGWLPDLMSLEANMSKHSRSALCASSIRILITNRMPSGSGTNAATYPQSLFVNKCVSSLSSRGFQVFFKPVEGTQAMNEIRSWLVFAAGS